MVALVFPERWKRQPQGVNVPDENHPSFRGLVFLANVDRPAPVIWTRQGGLQSATIGGTSPALMGSKLGVAMYGAPYSLTVPLDNPANVDCTVMALCDFTLYSASNINGKAYALMCRDTDAAGGGGWGAYIAHLSDGTAIFNTVISGGDRYTVGTTDVRGKTGVITGRGQENVSVDVFWNGIKEGTTPIGVSGWRGNAKGWAIGRNPEGAGHTAYSQVLAGIAWHRVLPDGEIKELSENPWQLFKRPSSRTYFIADSAPPPFEPPEPYYWVRGVAFGRMG